MFKKSIIVICCTVLTGCSTTNIKVPTVKEAAALDVSTTVLGLSRGATEINPLGPSNAILFKLLYMTGILGQRTPESDRWVTSLWTGAAANNLVGVVTLNPIFSLTMGSVVGYYIYQQCNANELDCAKPKVQK
jgi:hypothetical protein